MISTIEDANSHLLKISELKRKIDFTTNKYNAQIDEIKKRIHKETSEDAEQLQILEDAIQAFMKNTPDLFNKSKTVKLTFGKLTAKKTPPRLELFDGITWEDVLKNLYKNGFNDFVEVKEMPDKSAIKKSMPEEHMSLIGVRKLQDTNYNYSIG